jgi:hypothetical protein
VEECCDGELSSRPKTKFVYLYAHPSCQPDSLWRRYLLIDGFHSLVISYKEIRTGEDIGIKNMVLWVSTVNGKRVNRTNDTDQLSACVNIVKEAKSQGNQSSPLEHISIGIVIPLQESDLGRLMASDGA